MLVLQAQSVWIQQEFENASLVQWDVCHAHQLVLAINVTQQQHLHFLDKYRTQLQFVLRSVILETLPQLMETVLLVKLDVLSVPIKLFVLEFNKDLFLIKQWLLPQLKVLWTWLLMELTSTVKIFSSVHKLAPNVLIRRLNVLIVDKDSISTYLITLVSILFNVLVVLMVKMEQMDQSAFVINA